MSNNRDLGGDKAATHSDRVIETVSSSKAASSPLAASWSRSLNYFGLEPDSVESRERSKASEIKARQEELGLLLSIAQPAMDQLHATINLAGCSVFLSDSEGVVIDQRHAASDADVFETAGLSTGFVWQLRFVSAFWFLVHTRFLIFQSCFTHISTYEKRIGSH